MNDVQPNLDTGRWSGSRLSAIPWRVVGAFCVGALLMVALSVPAVLVPSTRTGATVAAALIAGAFAARGRSWPSRAGVGFAMGVALGLAVSAAAWGLLSDAPDPHAWQIVARNVVTHSMIAPLDEILAPKLGGFEQMEVHLLLARFTASNLVMGLAGGLLGGLLASGSAPGRREAPCAREDAEGQPPDGVEDAAESEDGLRDAQPAQGKDVEKRPPDGVEGEEGPEDGSDEPPSPKGEKGRDRFS